MDALERLGQHGDDMSATIAMDVAFQIESDATQHEFNVVAAAARALSMQAAELYLRHDAPIESGTLKANVDILSILLLRVYITGTDLDHSAPASHRAIFARPKACDRDVH
jgi:hypothetical protein